MSQKAREKVMLAKLSFDGLVYLTLTPVVIQSRIRSKYERMAASRTGTPGNAEREQRKAMFTELEI
jgi:hypothetical protein